MLALMYIRLVYTFQDQILLSPFNCYITFQIQRTRDKCIPSIIYITSSFPVLTGIESMRLNCATNSSDCLVREWCIQLSRSPYPQPTVRCEILRSIYRENLVSRFLLATSTAEFIVISVAITYMKPIINSFIIRF